MVGKGRRSTPQYTLRAVFQKNRKNSVLLSGFVVSSEAIVSKRCSIMISFGVYIFPSVLRTIE